MQVKNRAIVIFLILALFTGGLYQIYIVKQGPELSSEDRALFEKMWRVLYFRFNFGYTLLGSKPVSVGEWDKMIFSGFRRGRPVEALYIGQAKGRWEAFTKAYPSRHYALLFNEFTLAGRVYEEVVFINKEAVRKSFELHRQLFMDNLELDDDSPETITLKTLRSQNHELIGILLGFGIHNSKLFQRPYDLKSFYVNRRYFPAALDLDQDEVQWLVGLPESRVEKSDSLPPEKYSTVVKQVKQDEQKMVRTFELENPLSRHRLPGFVVDPKHPETDELLSLYREEQKKVVDFGLIEPFFDRILTIYFKGDL